MDPPKPGARAPRNVAEETEAEERGWSWVVSKENSGKGTTGVLGYAARGVPEEVTSRIAKKLPREAATVFAGWAIRLGYIRILALPIHTRQLNFSRLLLLIKRP